MVNRLQKQIDQLKSSSGNPNSGTSNMPSTSSSVISSPSIYNDAFGYIEREKELQRAISQLQMENHNLVMENFRLTQRLRRFSSGTLVEEERSRSGDVIGLRGSDSISSDASKRSGSISDLRHTASGTKSIPSQSRSNAPSDSEMTVGPLSDS